MIKEEPAEHKVRLGRGEKRSRKKEAIVAAGLRWLARFGGEELRRLRSERDRLAVYHNMRTFGRGGLRQGRTAAELAAISLPTNDWIELLDLTARPRPQAGTKAA
jgi:hypothetical protein